MERKRKVRLIVIAGAFVIIVMILWSILVSGERFGDKVALIEISGPILNSRGIIEELRRYKDDSSVKAIVLRIDSPGGVVAPTQEIHRELTKLDKRIVTSMGSVATSGGYYIACASDWIFANPGTLTGSIGVIMQFPNLEGLSKRLGIEREVVKSGSYKDAGSMYRKLTPQEKELFQETVSDVYEQFVSAVVEGRKHKKLTREQIKEIADGRVMSGKQALEKKLIDELGDLEDAIEYAGKISGIEGRPKVVRAKVKRSLLERLISSVLGNKLDQVIDSHVSIRYEPPF